MLNADERTNYLNQVILFLAHPDNRKTEFGYDDLAEMLGVPKEYKGHVWDALMSSNGLISGKPALKNPLIKIAPNGLKYADGLEQNYYDKYGTPIQANFVDMTMNQTCELIFQEHKKSPTFSMIWTKETFKPYVPKNVGEAKEIMERKGIIFQSSHSNIKTILSDNYHQAEDYNEALKIFNEIHDKPKVTSITHQGTGNVFSQSSVSAERNIDMSQRVTTTPNIKNSAYGKISWYNKPLFTHYIWPLLVALTVLAIAILLAQKYGLST